MVSDWIVGIWTLIATIMVMHGCIIHCVIHDDAEAEVANKFLIAGLFMAIFSAMHYSGM